MGVIVTACEELPIRRNLGDEGEQVYERHATATLGWHSPDPRPFIGSYKRVIQPLAIRRESGEVVSLAGCQLLGVASIHITSPRKGRTGHPTAGQNDMAEVMG